jgi:hypothetical protein
LRLELAEFGASLRQSDKFLSSLYRIAMRKDGSALNGGEIDQK